jgi:hypothetical protein
MLYSGTPTVVKKKMQSTSRFLMELYEANTTSRNRGPEFHFRNEFATRTLQPLKPIK